MELNTVAFCLFGLIAVVSGRPNYIDCVDSLECGKEECCSIGMGRFTMPQCRERPNLGDVCRLNSYPLNTTVSYPDGYSVTLTNVYQILCPCNFGLICGDRGICEDPADKELFNQLYY